MKIIKNYLYNVIYQILLIIIPVITVPYISRIFTPEQLGINSYTFSIVQYFVLFATLGVKIYGNRTIAYIREDRKKTMKTFWSIFFAILFTTLLSIIGYSIFLLFFVRDYIQIYFIQSLYIFSVAIDISWLFMGMEDFKKVVIRNTTVKIIGTMMIFVFVKDSTDFYLYIFLLAITNFIGYISMWFFIKEYIIGFYFNINEIKKHFMPLFKIYIPQIAIQIYVVMDKTMIGILSDTTQVGYYDMSQRIVKIVLSVLTSLGIVMIPHISNLIANQKLENVEKSIGLTFKYMLYLAYPMAFGLSLISQSFTVWFFGPNFLYTGVLMKYSSFIIIAITLSNIIGMQLLMPMMKEKEFTLSVICGAILNVILNLLLIPKYGAFGAVIATIIGEFTVTLIQVVLIKKYINVIPYILESWKSLLSSIIMYIGVHYLTIKMLDGFLTNIIQVLIGVLIYIIIMYILKSEIQIDIYTKVKHFSCSLKKQTLL